MEFVSADIQRLLTGIAGTVAQSAGRLALALVGGFILARVLRTLLVQLERVLVRAGERTGALAAVTRSRVATLTSVLRTLALVVLWSVVAVVCLSQLGLDVRPILAGAGIVGLAVGFGAQYLVRDVIAGFFLVLEDQVRVGDVAVVNGTGGLVETVTFRTIVLRDLAGTLHIFQNGAVTTLANMTRGWSGYVVDVEVPFREDPDRVIAVMRRVGDELRADPAHGAAHPGADRGVRGGRVQGGEPRDQGPAQDPADPAVDGGPGVPSPPGPGVCQPRGSTTRPGFSRSATPASRCPCCSCRRLRAISRHRCRAEPHRLTGPVTDLAEWWCKH